jgi:hypothetical protein
MISNTNQAPQLPQNAVKCRFFAQYWGQNILHFQHDVNFSYFINPQNMFGNEFNHQLDNAFIELKPLSKITDEDALGVANIISSNIHDSITKELVSYYKQDILKDSEVLCYASYQTVDFMRSKGYALAFTEHSVEDLVSFGWVRLV